MSEILHGRLTKNIGRNIKIFLKDNFRFEGELLGYDEKFIEIFDTYKELPIIINIKEIKEIYILDQK